METDSYEAFTLLELQKEDTNPNKVLIANCKRLLGESNSSIRHILRERNQCADALANLGVQQEEWFVPLKGPPPEILMMFEVDIANIVFVREP